VRWLVPVLDASSKLDFFLRREQFDLANPRRYMMKLLSHFSREDGDRSGATAVSVVEAALR